MSKQAEAPPPALTISVAHTHLYPGATLRLGEGPAPDPEGFEVWIEFSDGIGVWGWLAKSPGPRCMLEVDEYVTAAQHRVGAKVWIIQADRDDPRAFKVRDHGEPSERRARI